MEEKSESLEIEASRSCEIDQMIIDIVGVVVRDDFIAYFLEGVLQAQLAHARGDEVCADLGGFVVFLSVHLSGVFEQTI